MPDQPNRLTQDQAFDVITTVMSMANAENHIDHSPGVVAKIILEKHGLVVRNSRVIEIAKNRGFTINGTNHPKDNERIDELEMRITAIEGVLRNHFTDLDPIS